MPQVHLNGADYIVVMLADPITGLPITPAGSGVNPATIITGQKKIAVTGTAVQLSVASLPLKNGLVVKAKSTNVATGVVGPVGVTNTVDGTGNGFTLDPGEAASFGVTDGSTIWFNGTANDVFTWEGN